MIWSLKKFQELTVDELYAILQLRNEVFAVEQNCVYPDLDNKDQSSWHLMGWKEKKLIAYTRLIPPGIAYPEASIGRVVTSPSVRGQKIGRELMERSIKELYRLFGRQPICLGAQLYLREFYYSLRFIQSGEPYLEDGIPHIQMKLG
jgi:ElaA protein